MGDAGIGLIAVGALTIVAGIAVLARVPGRRRWPQLLVGTGVVLLLAGLLIRSSTPRPDPCATADPHTCAVSTGGSP